MTIVYDTRFNLSEWFCIITFVCGYTFFFLTFKRRFSIKHSLVYLLYGIFIVTIWDHNIGIEPIDFYDVNNSNKTEAIDVVHYLMFGPYSYTFAYLYDALRTRIRVNIPLYILGWSLFSFGMEWFSSQIGLYHYKNGFITFYSFPFYISAQSGLYLMFHYFNRIRKST